MQVEIKLNRMQRYKLYEKLLPLGKGRPHWRLIQRIYDALRCDEIEDIYEKNRELRDAYLKVKAEAEVEKRAAPPAPDLVELRVTDDTAPFVLDEGDLEFAHRKTRVWDDEKEGPDGTEWRVLLPLLDAIDAAWEAVQKRPCKSNGETVPADTQAENRPAAPAQ